MNAPTRTMAQRVADAVMKFQVDSTGHAPRAVTVVLSDDTLVVTLHEALSAAEVVLSQTESGAAQVQEYHRQLFQSAIPALREQIKQITGVAVLEAAAEIEPTTGAIVHAFTSGEMVQVYRMSKSISALDWNSTDASP